MALDIQRRKCNKMCGCGSKNNAQNEITYSVYHFISAVAAFAGSVTKPYTHS